MRNEELVGYVLALPILLSSNIRRLATQAKPQFLIPNSSFLTPHSLSKGAFVRVKICGITNLEDALHAIACGADALGFVFYEKSPRYINVEEARKITDALPPFVERVGLFVNMDAPKVKEQCDEAGMSIAQIHFDVDDDYFDRLDMKGLPVVRAKSKEDIEKFSDRYRLVDAYCEAYGGAGKRLNLEWFEGVDCSKIILAGGLDPSNLHELKSFGFYGVDVSSGVEKSKGKKDFKKVEQFIANAKSL